MSTANNTSKRSLLVVLTRGCFKKLIIIDHRKKLLSQPRLEKEEQKRHFKQQTGGVLTNQLVFPLEHKTVISESSPSGCRVSFNAGHSQDTSLSHGFKRQCTRFLSFYDLDVTRWAHNNILCEASVKWPELPQVLISFNKSFLSCSLP